MSYILEALKKAQAERQLGHAPTIHAPTLHHAPPRLPAVKKSGALAVGAGVVVVAMAAWFAWSQRTPAPAAVLTPAATVAASAPAPAPAPVVAAPAPVAVPTPAPVAAPAPAPVVQAEPVARPRKVAPAKAPVPAPAPAPAPAGVDDNIRFARDLPPDVQQQLPRIAFGGYMYSENAADRLVLVDKTLRHEGEEIAPGLTLERLLPKGAVLNYRGTRYRVGF
jgi:general secretion pathway protein B